jgi:signal transduction histidine kinase
VRILFTILFVVSGLQFVLSQSQNNADSLLRVLNNEKNLDDSSRCILYTSICFNERDPSKQKKYALILIDFAISTNNEIGVFDGFYFLGYAEKYMGNHVESMKHFFKCLEYAKNISKKHECDALTAIGDVYSINTDFKNALLYYNKAIFELANLDQPYNDQKKNTSLAVVYLNAGDAYYLLSKLDSAKLYFDEAKDLFKELNNKVGLAYCLGNMGLIYAKNGDHNKAEININQAIATFIETGEYYAIASFYTYMADIYLQKNDIDQALYYAKESYEKASEYNLKEQMRDASLKLYELYEAKGDHAKALKCHVEYVALKDSVTNMESVQKMANLRTEYEVGQKQTEVDLLTAEKKVQQVIIWGIVAFSVMLIVLSFIIYRFYRAKKQINLILEAQKKELETVNRTKDKFFSIISHDLRGPVTAFHGVSRMIRYFVSKNEIDQLLEISDHIDQSVEGISDLLDNLLNWAMQQHGQFPYAPTETNLNAIGREMSSIFKNMALSKKIHLEIKIDGEIDLYADKNMVSTIIRNLISNALKFTTSDQSVMLLAASEGTMAHIQIKDTGVGIDPEKLEKIFSFKAKNSTFGTSGEKGLGLGLQLVNEFVHTNGGRINVESEVNKGTTFHIFLPLFIR